MSSHILSAEEECSRQFFTANIFRSDSVIGDLQAKLTSDTNLGQQQFLFEVELHSEALQNVFS
jgi:hypothetical protein